MLDPYLRAERRRKTERLADLTKNCYHERTPLIFKIELGMDSPTMAKD